MRDATYHIVLQINPKRTRRVLDLSLMPPELPPSLSCNHLFGYSGQSRPSQNRIKQAEIRTRIAMQSHEHARTHMDAHVHIHTERAQVHADVPYKDVTFCVFLDKTYACILLVIYKLYKLVNYIYIYICACTGAVWFFTSFLHPKWLTKQI